MNQIERINHYEALLNEGEEIVNDLLKALDNYHAFKDSFDELAEYYQSEERKLDVKADEEDRLPKDLFRGVLGEDYLNDLLALKDEIDSLIK